MTTQALTLDAAPGYEGLNKAIQKAIVLAVVVGCPFPFNFPGLAHYMMNGGHLALALFGFLYVPVLLLRRSYRSSRTVHYAWGLRGLAAAVFVLAGFQRGFSAADFTSFLGTIFLTFFLEFGFFVLDWNLWTFFVKSWALTATVISSYVLYFLTPLVWSLRLPAAYMTIVRDNVHYAWPNQFSVYLLLGVLAILYLAKTKRAYLLLLLPVVPTLVFTFSRTTFLTLVVLVALKAVHNYRARHDAPRFLVVFTLTVIMTLSAFVAINTVKETDTIEVPGSEIEHSIRKRLSRWGSMLRVVGDNPVLGVGMRSTSRSVGTFTSYQGTVAPVRSSHNDYVDIVIRGGIPYFVAFMAFVIWVLARNFRALSGPYARQQLLAHFWLVVVLLDGITHNPLKDVITASIFWVAVAATARFSDAGDGDRTPANLRSPAA